MDLFTVPAQGLDVPAWFGKLPGMGDFGQRRLAPLFLDLWDTWLQKGLQQLRAEREDWVAHYLHAPLWFFALGEEVVNPHPWIGVLMPCVDSVGRYFPLTLAIELVRSNEPSIDHQMACIHHWWQRSAKAALTALDSNMDAVSFDSYLYSLFGKSADLESRTPSMLALPGSGMSSWSVDAGVTHGAVNTTSSLPGVDGFAVLFGYANLAIAHRKSQ